MGKLVVAHELCRYDGISDVGFVDNGGARDVRACHHVVRTQLGSQPRALGSPWGQWYQA